MAGRRVNLLFQGGGAASSPIRPGMKDDSDPFVNPSAPPMPDDGFHSRPRVGRLRSRGSSLGYEPMPHQLGLGVGSSSDYYTGSPLARPSLNSSSLGGVGLGDDDDDDDDDDAPPTASLFEKQTPGRPSMGGGGASVLAGPGGGGGLGTPGILGDPLDVSYGSSPGAPGGGNSSSFLSPGIGGLGGTGLGGAAGSERKRYDGTTPMSSGRGGGEFKDGGLGHSAAAQHRLRGGRGGGLDQSGASAASLHHLNSPALGGGGSSSAARAAAAAAAAALTSPGAATSVGGVAMMAPALRDGEDRRWVTVFGFPSTTDSVNTVLRHFQKCGDIVNHVLGKGNWLHLRYQKAEEADRARSVNGELLSNHPAAAEWMIGVVAGTEPLSHGGYRHARGGIAGAGGDGGIGGGGGGSGLGITGLQRGNLHGGLRNRAQRAGGGGGGGIVDARDVLNAPRRRDGVCTRVMNYLFGGW